MLVSFTMENFRAFRDEATLDLRKRGQSAAGAVPWDKRLETIAAIYGANASGKTALFKGIQWLQELVCLSYRLGRVDAQPFRLDDESSERPTYLAATFVADDGVCYAYGVGVQSGRVVEEWAERYTTARPTLLFERNGNDFTYGTALSGPKRSVENTVSESTLFLSAAAAARFDGLMPLYRWFADNLRCYSASGHQGFYETVFEELERDADARSRVLTMLTESDLGLRGVEFTRRRLSELEKRSLEQRAELLRSYDPLHEVEVVDETVEATFLHEGQGGLRGLDFDDESDGTKAMLCHAFVVDQALTFGRTVVFDEIDASLHPLLVAAVIRLFLDKERNPRQAQFVFTTHDVSLLEPTSPRGAAIAREHMWVTDKGIDGASRLTAVEAFQPRPRKDDNLRRRYLVGRFGGIPDNAEYGHVGDLARVLA